MARLLSEGQPLPFINLATCPAPEERSPQLAEELKEASRKKCGKHKKIVEQEINERLMAILEEAA